MLSRGEHYALARGGFCPRFHNWSYLRDAGPGERGSRRGVLGGMLPGMLSRILVRGLQPRFFFFPLEGSGEESGLRPAGKGLFSFRPALPALGPELLLPEDSSSLHPWEGLGSARGGQRPSPAPWHAAGSAEGQAGSLPAPQSSACPFPARRRAVPPGLPQTADTAARASN